jgi:predicted  nucleic acid-binding Zn-ribbon protein
MIVEAAQANPELKAMHEAQIAKNRALEEKRREVIGNTPELKAIQDEIMAKRKEIGELERKIFAGLKDNPDLQKLRAESDTAWNELAKKASENNPELGKAIEELEAAKKAARPPAEKPEKKEQPKE